MFMLKLKTGIVQIYDPGASPQEKLAITGIQRNEILTQRIRLPRHRCSRQYRGYLIHATTMRVEFTCDARH